MVFGLCAGEKSPAGASGRPLCVDLGGDDAPGTCRHLGFAHCEALSEKVFPPPGKAANLVCAHPRVEWSAG
jgi:hypothetical protein